METPKRWSPIQELIFLDRYAQKAPRGTRVAPGTKVVVQTNDDFKYPQKHVAYVNAYNDDRTVDVLTVDGDHYVVPIERVDVPTEFTPKAMWQRMANAIARQEVGDDWDNLTHWKNEFLWLLEDWKFVPGGRINAMLGTDQNLTAYNCYVIPLKEDDSPTRDSRKAIIHTLHNMIEIMSRGGGVGINLSPLRPRLAYVRGVNGRSSGAVSWGELFSTGTNLVEQGGSRRGALMLILNVWHPDILEFITCKQDMGVINYANISVGLTTEFEKAVENDEDWELRFPDYEAVSAEFYEKNWSGDLERWISLGGPVKVYKTIKARKLWQMLVESAWKSAEPGIVRLDYANKMYNGYYFNTLTATNPCAEQFLPEWGVCNLGHINLSKFIDDKGEILWDDLAYAVRLGVRFLDNVIDITPYFFEENEKVQKQERRIGMGTMGLAELLIKAKVRYGSSESLALIDKLYCFITNTAYQESARIAKEKGPFPMCNIDMLLESKFIKKLGLATRDAIMNYGLRNVCLLTQAPTGTTGTMVGTSTGIEPYYQWEYIRQGRLGKKIVREAIVDEFFDANPELSKDLSNLPDYFVTALELTPEEHVRVQAGIQKWTDSSISKTTNCPGNWTVEQVDELFKLAWKLGCKGITIYRDKSRNEQVLSTITTEEIKVEDSQIKTTTKSDKIEDFETASTKAVRKVPAVVTGKTYRQQTPIGTARITINEMDGEPFEAIIVLGKGGMDITADAEAIGRLISLYLRTPTHISNREKLTIIKNQLLGIGGASRFGLGPNRVLSLPDALGKAFERYIGGEEEKDEPRYYVDFDVNDSSSADLCPMCGSLSLVYAEGCYNCKNCGHSKC